jgi:hypothetical protein
MDCRGAWVRNSQLMAEIPCTRNKGKKYQQRAHIDVNGNPDCHKSDMLDDFSLRHIHFEKTLHDYNDAAPTCLCLFAR